MDINRKKVLLIPLEDVLTDGGGLTDFHIRREILDRVRKLNISRMAIIYGESDDKDYYSKVKSIEFFVFTYCKIAVSAHQRNSNVVDEILNTLPHNIRKRELFISLEENIDGIDNINLEKFLS